MKFLTLPLLKKEREKEEQKQSKFNSKTPENSFINHIT